MITTQRSNNDCAICQNCKFNVNDNEHNTGTGGQHDNEAHKSCVPHINESCPTDTGGQHDNEAHESCVPHISESCPTDTGGQHDNEAHESCPTYE